MAEKLQQILGIIGDLATGGLEEAKEHLRKIMPLLLDLSPTEIEDFLGWVKSKTKIPGRWLQAYRKEIHETRKVARLGTAKSDNGDHRLCANFPGLVEIVANEDGNSAFLVKTPNGFQVAITWASENGELRPPPVDKIPWLLPRTSEVLSYIEHEDPPERLWADLLEYFQNVSELPSPLYHLLQVAWVFHTYLLKEASYSPEICLYAVPERGKSRTGKAMVYVARRGVHVESLRDAYLVRLANDYHATIFFDCLDFWRRAEKAGCEDIVLGSFERGIKVPRVLYPERGPHRDTVFYDIFGPTIIATNVAVSHILDTRCVQINMPQARGGNFETDITPAAALPLKERLTAWRARVLGKPVPDCQKPAPGRLGDILKPLLQMVLLVAPAYEADFRALVAKIQRTRTVDKATGPEAQILLVVKSLESEVRRGILAVKTITDAYNEDRPDREKLTYQRMGRKLRSLGFTPAQTETSAAAILWEPEKIARLFWAYGLTETSETSETPADDPDIFARPSAREKTHLHQKVDDAQSIEDADIITEIVI